MPRKTFLLALVSIVVVGGVLWLLYSGGGGTGRAPGVAARGQAAERPAAEPPAGPEAPTALAEPEPVPAKRTEADRARPGDRASAKGDAGSFPTADAQWIEVTLHVPAGVPADDHVALLSFSHSDGEPLQEWDRRNIAEDVGLSGDFAGELRRNVAWARRELTGSNTVRLPFHPRAKDGMVLVQSRYVFAPPATVRLGASAGPITIEGELGAYVTGRCVLPPGAEGRGIEPDDFEIELDGRPRDGATPFAMDDTRKARLDDDFSFELRALSADRKYSVQAQAEKLVDHFQVTYEVEAGEHAVLEIPLELGGEIRGRVLGDDGRPVAGANVQAESSGLLFLNGNEEEADTAADGTFTLFGIAAGDVEIRVRADGWLDPELEPLAIADGETLDGIVIRLERGKGIAGRVLWPDGTPAKGARVVASVARQQGWSNRVGQALSDEEGRFELTGLEQGPFELRAEANPDPNARPRAASSPAAVLEGVAGEVFEELPAATESTAGKPEARSSVDGDDDWVAVRKGVVPDAADVVLTLVEPLVVDGTVADDTGAPVETFSVQARPAGAPIWGSDRDVEGSFDSPDGTFHLRGVFPGDWTVTASAEGYAPSPDPVSVTVPLQAPVRIVLSRGSSVAGVVLDPRGRPAAEAKVLAQKGGSGNPFGLSRPEETTAGPDGRFAFEGLAPSGVSLLAQHDDWAASEPVPVEAPPGGAIDDLVLHLRVGGVVTGEVYDEEGEPDTGQNVTLGSQGLGMGLQGKSTVTDAAGRFRFDGVTPGKVFVTAMPSEEEIVAAAGEAGGEETAMMNFMGQMRMQSVDVADGQEVHVVLGSKPRDPVRVHGRVTEAGAALAGAQVLALEEGGALVQGMKAVKTDEHGRYELLLDRPGDFVFNVSADPSVGTGIQFYVDVPEAPEYERDLAMPLGRISGRVLGPDGSPAEGVGVRVAQMGGVFGIEDFDMSRNHSVDADGRYSFEHLQPGTYAVQVGGFGSSFTTGNEQLGAAVVDGIEVGPDESVEGVDIHLKAAGKLAGTVRDATGKAVAGVTVFVRDAKGRVLSPISATTTDAAGRFTYGGLAPGDVTVCARTAQLASKDVGPVEVVAGQTVTVDLEVDTGAFLVVSLLDGDEPVRARVQVTNQDGLQVGGMISAEALQAFFVEGFSSRERRIGPVPPGEYTLVATAPDGKSAKKTVTVKAGQEERKLKLRLR